MCQWTFVATKHSPPLLHIINYIVNKTWQVDYCFKKNPNYKGNFYTTKFKLEMRNLFFKRY